MDIIKRVVHLWSNPGDTIFSPFAGIGSELYGAVEMGRRAVGIELKKSYFDHAGTILTNLEIRLRQKQLDIFIAIGSKHEAAEERRLAKR
jgi:DNA modification methylase